MANKGKSRQIEADAVEPSLPASKSTSTAQRSDNAGRREILEPAAFIRQQMDLLATPLARADIERYAAAAAANDNPKALDQGGLDRAIELVEAELSSSRSSKYSERTIRAVAEQVEDLVAQPDAHPRRAAKKATASGHLRVDRDEWLQDLPTHWPSTASKGNAGTDLLDEYSRLIASVRRRQSSQAYLQQQAQHYELLLDVLGGRNDALPRYTEEARQSVAKESRGQNGAGKA